MGQLGRIPVRRVEARSSRSTLSPRPAIGGRPVTGNAERTFEQAIGQVEPAHALITRLRGLADAPDEVAFEFGVELSAEVGAFIAAASTPANFRVSLTWRRA